MKTNIKLVNLFCLFILLSLNQNIFGQDKKDAKMNKNMKEALDERHNTDSRYANSQRELYKLGTWKKSWEGVKYTELIKKWGAPTRSFPDGEGGTVSVYEKIDSYTGGIYEPGYIETATNGYGQTVVTGSKRTIDTRRNITNTETTTVFVGKDNLIKKIDWGFKSN
jgi:hypothetical protein